MEPIETSHRMQDLLDSMRTADARIALSSIRIQARKATAFLEGLDASLGLIPEILPLNAMSSRMLISLWSLRCGSPELLSTADAKLAFCEQVATICGDEVTSFEQAVHICQKAVDERTANQALLAYRQQTLLGLHERIASERHWLDECNQWASRIETELRLAMQDDEQEDEEGIFD